MLKSAMHTLDVEEVKYPKHLHKRLSTTTFCLCMYRIFSAAANAPTGLAAEVVGHASIRVSWTAPDSGAPVTGYRIYYQEEDDEGRVINLDRVDVRASTTEHNITLVLTAGHRYVITVRTLSRQLPSSAVGPPTVTIGKST